MLHGVEYSLRRVRCLHHIVLRAADAVRLGSLVQDKTAAPPAPVALRQQAVVAEDHQLAILNEPTRRFVCGSIVLFQYRGLGAIRSEEDNCE